MATKSKSHIPSGLTPIIPQLVLQDAKATVEFYKQALGAELLHSFENPPGVLMHGALRVGEGTIFVSEATGFAKPTSANLFVYVKDVDAVYARAVKAGATVLAPLANMFWGDRWGMVADPAGNIWQLATNTEEVSPEEMQARMKAANAPK